MPKGIPNKKLENVLDNKLEAANIDSMLNLSKKENVMENSHLAEFEEIISPDGKYKTRRPKNIEFAEFRANTTGKIPNYIKPGYKIAWPTDARPNYLPEQLMKRWDYLRPETGGVIDATTGQEVYLTEDNVKVSAQMKDKDGRAIFHYAMIISDEQYKKLAESQSRHNKKEIENSLKMTIGGKLAGVKEYNSITNAISRGENLIG